jgi:hypothetical protein
MHEGPLRVAENDKRKDRFQCDSLKKKTTVFKVAKLMDIKNNPLLMVREECLPGHFRSGF